MSTDLMQIRWGCPGTPPSQGLGWRVPRQLLMVRRHLLFGDALKAGKAHEPVHRAEVLLVLHELEEEPALLLAVGAGLAHRAILLRRGLRPTNPENFSLLASLSSDSRCRTMSTATSAGSLPNVFLNMKLTSLSLISNLRFGFPFPLRSGGCTMQSVPPPSTWSPIFSMMRSTGRRFEGMTGSNAMTK